MLRNKKLKISTYLIVAVTFCFSLVLLSGIVKAEKAPTTKDPLIAIDNDYKSGALTIDEKVLLQITAIKDSKKLPSKYQLSESPDERVVFKSASLAIRDIILGWDQLQTSTQETYNQMMVRPTTSYTYDSPSGFFKLHYEITGDDAVPTDDDNSNGIPDYVEKCAVYCDSSLDKSLDLGYYTPPSDNGTGGDELYDIYFVFPNLLDRNPGMTIPAIYIYIIIFSVFPLTTTPKVSGRGRPKLPLPMSFTMPHNTPTMFRKTTGLWSLMPFTWKISPTTR